MNYRLYQDLANQHISELEQEAHDVRLGRPPGALAKSRFSNSTGLVRQLVTPLRRLFGSHRLGVRTLASSSPALQLCEFDTVADRTNPVFEVVGGASHNAGLSGHQLTCDHSAPTFEEQWTTTAIRGCRKVCNEWR